jgi:hypothetical protein
VQSSAISWIGYVHRTRTLFVRFVDGDLYSYEPVPSGVYAGFLAATSFGRYFAANIRDRYRHRRLDEIDEVLGEEARADA